MVAQRTTLSTPRLDLYTCEPPPNAPLKPVPLDCIKIRTISDEATII